jgi:hypothetical protein
LTIACLIAVCGSAQEAKDSKAKDTELLDAIKAAADKETQPEKVEAVVGRKATVNTIRKADRDVLSIANIAEDPERKPVLPRGEAPKWVAYWVRRIDTRNPKIVGIFWPEKGKPQVFYGEVLPHRLKTNNVTRDSAKSIVTQPSKPASSPLLPNQRVRSARPPGG